MDANPEGREMAIERSLLGRLSKTWLEAQKKAKPKAKHLVVVTKRPKLIADQKSIAKVFGKTKCHAGLAVLVTEEELGHFAAYAKYCTHAEI